MLRPGVLASRGRDAAAVASIWVVTILLTQRWAGLDTPDSSFYTSLGLFGSEVSDRAYDNSYFWTRLGVIAPTRLLTSLLGTWGGLTAWHWLLLLMVIAGAYATVRRFAALPLATALTACIALSTVPLSYLANPYLTGAVLAGTSVLVAAALSDSRGAAITSGVIMGWLVMVNPPGVLLAGVVWLSLRVQRLLAARRAAPARRVPLLQPLAWAAGATVVTFIVFLGIGRLVFPELNWFAAYLDAQGINLSDFASKDPIWMRDISMLVPAVVLVITVVIWLARRRHEAAQLALTLSASSVAFMLVFSPLMGGIALEAPMYQAMLWPPALIALALGAAAVADPHGTGDPADQRSSVSITALAVAAVVLVVVVVAGHWSGALDLTQGRLLALALVGLTALLVLLMPPRLAPVGALLMIGLVVTGGQLLQNSRGSLGLYYLSPYSWAFNANPISEKLHTAVNTQEWLLANTTNDDTVLTWVDGDWVDGDRELYVVAGMQLWGENRIGLFAELDDDDRARLEAIRPSVIAMYGQSIEGVATFMRGLPASTLPTAPTCYDFTWPAPHIPAGHACITRLTWTTT